MHRRMGASNDGRQHGRARATASTSTDPSNDEHGHGREQQVGAGGNECGQVSNECGQVSNKCGQVRAWMGADDDKATHSPSPSSSSSSSTPFHLAKRAATSIDVRVLLSRGCKKAGGGQTRGYRGFRTHRGNTAEKRVRFVPVPATGTVSAGTGAGSDFPTRGLPVPTTPTDSESQMAPGTNYGDEDAEEHGG